MSTTACFAPGVRGLLSPLQDFLDDEAVSEILINRPHEVFVERDGRMQKIDAPTLTPHYLRRLFLLMANENGQVLSEEKPLLSGNLEDGSRVQLVIPPASRHETLSIRTFTLKSMRFDDYGQNGFFNQAKAVSLEKHEKKDDDVLQRLYAEHNWQAFLIEAIRQKKTMLISGATSSGKTTFLNGCLQEIPAEERLITLEDTYELKLAHPNHVRLKAIKGNETLTLQDLVQASLRLRPDRLIMGEIRGREIFDFVSACSTGHNGSLATIHADNPRGAFMRMAQLYKLNNVPGMREEDIYEALHEVIDIVVQLKKTDQGRQLREVYYRDGI